METKKLIIIGSGPAGYSAGIYGARAELEPVIFAGEIFGGQLMNTTLVENWPGQKNGILGPELMQEMREQAKKFGAEIINKNVTQVDFSKRPFKVVVGNDEYRAEGVIVATGAESVMLGVPGEKEFLGRGVATCAVCDAPFYRGKNVVVVGGGDAAVEDAMALAKFATKVTMLVRRESLKASKVMIRRVENENKVEIRYQVNLKEVVGKERVEAIRIANNGSGKDEEMKIDGVFLAIGHKPITEMFKGQLDLDARGYLVTGLGYSEKGIKLAQDRYNENGLVMYPTMTNVEGVFGAGDVVDLRYRQAVTAAAMGCQAALDAEKWLEEKVR